MALADSVHALALDVYAKRPAGVAPTAWLTDSTGVPAHRVARRWPRRKLKMRPTKIDVSEWVLWRRLCWAVD